MIIALPIFGGILTGLPIIAIALVSIASRLEDRAWTAAGPPPTRAQSLARRIVGFYSEGTGWLLNAGRSRDRQCPADAKPPLPTKVAA